MGSYKAKCGLGAVTETEGGETMHGPRYVVMVVVGVKWGWGAGIRCGKVGGMSDQRAFFRVS